MNRYTIEMISGYCHEMQTKDTLLELSDAIRKQDTLFVNDNKFIKTKHVESVRISI